MSRRARPILRHLALLLAAGFLFAACGDEQPVTSSEVPANTPVILISVDTLRSDHLPMYGYDRIETPSLDRLRADSILYEHAYASVPLTLPSHGSILTGLDPDHHGVRSNVGYRLSSSIQSVPRALGSKGYETGAAVSAWVLRSETGLGDHFDFYDDRVGAATGISFASVQRPGAETASVAIEWIRQHSGTPFFFMLHLFEPHTPYEPPEDLAGRYEDPYDGEIVATDRIVGAFLDELRTLGIYDKALIVFLSDHGEGLGDHGEPGHGIFIYREAIQVPLLVKLPGSERAGESIPEAVGLIDVAPTLLSVLDFDVPDAMQGSSLLGFHDPDRSIYSETLYPRIHLGWSELRSIVRGDHHYIEAPEPELYDVKRDPAETKNILSDERRLYASLREELSGRPLALTDPASVDPEEAAKLAALGYLGSTTASGDGDRPDPKEKIGELQVLIDAMNLASAGDRPRAVMAFRRLLETNPNLAEGWLQLGRLLDEEGRWPEALEAYQSAMRIAPTASGETALTIAEILIRLERFDEAERHVDLGHEVNPARATLIRARIEAARGDLARAEALARSVPEGVEKDEATVLLAEILVKQSRLQEAMEIVERTGRRVLGAGGTLPEGLLFVRGDILARLDRLDEARESFEKEIELHPGYSQAYANLALVELLQGDLDKARNAIERMVRANPNERTRAFAAHTLEQLGDEQGALRYR